MCVFSNPQGREDLIVYRRRSLKFRWRGNIRECCVYPREGIRKRRFKCRLFPYQIKRDQNLANKFADFPQLSNTLKFTWESIVLNVPPQMYSKI